MGDVDRAPAEVMILRACELYGIPPGVAETIDRGRVETHLNINAIGEAIRQSEASAANMTPGQLDLIAAIRGMKREIEDDDEPSDRRRPAATEGPTIQGDEDTHSVA